MREDEREETAQGVVYNVLYKRVCNTSECATLTNFGGALRKKMLENC